MASILVMMRAYMMEPIISQNMVLSAVLRVQADMCSDPGVRSI